MKSIALALAAALTLLATSGCVVVPARHRAVVVETPVYVEPTYASPGPGWVWQVHPVYGYGWYHRDRGWHRGWRQG